MPMFSHGNDGQWVNGEFLQERINALRLVSSIDELGDIEIERYDLDDLPSTLGGPMLERQYQINRDLKGEVEQADGFDLREIPGHE